MRLKALKTGTEILSVNVLTSILRPVLVCLALLQIGCYRNSQGESYNQWLSKHHPIAVKLPQGWEVVSPFKDTAEGVTVAVIDNTDGCSMVVKVTPDVPHETVSDERYFTAVREQMINHSPENRLIDETEIVFENATYHRMRFTMQNKTFKTLFCQNLYTRRTGALSIGCQLNYPISSAANLEFPKKMIRLLEGLELFESSN